VWAVSGFGVEHAAHRHLCSEAGEDADAGPGEEDRESVEDLLPGGVDVAAGDHARRGEIDRSPNWVRPTEVDAGKRDGLTSGEREELVQLRRENCRLREDVEILKQATAFLAPMPRQGSAGTHDGGPVTGHAPGERPGGCGEWGVR
jgi:transposase-like protein